MKFYIEDVLVCFPYEYIYPEQLEYMTELKKGLDRQGHILLEMPSGTGKTISLLSLLVAYVRHRKEDRRRVVYCTRTVEEMTKTMHELQKLVACWEREGHPLADFRGVCLSARKNLCIEPSVAGALHLPEVDAACRRKTAPWATENRCTFFDTLEDQAVELPCGVYDLDTIRDFGESRNVCPYFLVRRAIPTANIIVHSYLYMVDPSISSVVREHMDERAIIVMDEGHNVDDVCIEAMSMVVTKRDAAEARDQNMKSLHQAVDAMKSTNRQRLQEEYDQLVNGLAMSRAAQRAGAEGPRAEQQLAVPADLAEEAVPGNIRQAAHFVTFLQRLSDFMFRLVNRITRPYVAEPLVFLTKVKEECSIDIRHLRFVSERLRILLNTLQVAESHRFRHISNIAHMFATLGMHFSDDRFERPGFVVVCEPHDPSRPNVPDPVVRLVCVDASLAVRNVFGFFKSVVLTSGTLSPLDIYPKILSFQPVVSKSFRMTLSRKCIAPVIVTRSSEQTQLGSDELSSSFKVRLQRNAQESVSRAYATLLKDLAQTVPDGIVCFFTGYQYMSEVMLQWHGDGTLDALAQHKLIFVETQGVQETSVALANYRTACDIGRGAIFMSIARGKIAEGIDFDRHYGRAVVMFGVPFLPPTDEPLRQRMQWMESCLGISESEYRNFDAVRQASQCIGRVLRNKTDYGMMILVDRRFALNDKRKKFPNWIQQCFKENTNLSVDSAVSVARNFFREMAQPWDHIKDLGTTLYNIDTLRSRGLEAPQELSYQPQPQDAPALVLELPDDTERLVAAPEPTGKKRSRTE